MIRVPIGNERSMRVEVRSVAPDANPYMVMYSIFKTGLEGETSKIKNLRQASRYLPDNIYDAIANFKSSKWTTKMLGEDVKGRYAELEAVLGRPLPAPARHIRKSPRSAISSRGLQPVPLEFVLEPAPIKPVRNRNAPFPLTRPGRFVFPVVRAVGYLLVIDGTR